MRPLAILVAAMALALATAGTAQAGIQLSKILPNPAVAPVGQTLTNAEFVVVKNTAAKAKNLRGWFIREKHSKRTFTFPGFSLCGGCSVKIHSGTGTNTASDLYWGRAAGLGERQRQGDPAPRPPPTLGKTFSC